MSRAAAMLRALAAGERVDPAALDALPAAERAAVIDALLRHDDGRRWLRDLPALPAALADSLLAHEDDFRVTRRDHTLAAPVRRATPAALRDHAAALAAGPAAAALWQRLAGDADTLTTVAADISAGADAQAAEATLYLLALDPLDPYRLGDAARGRIAAAGLRSPDAGVRGLAAEFLAQHAPAELLADFDPLVRDVDERVRGAVWNAAFALARIDAAERATQLVGDEAESLPARRSALAALGAHSTTAEIAELLAWAVVHPNATLASDAANLLDTLHRNPTAALAAQGSPHEHVRAVAARLLDPLRGSPAAGGSRPGDPTRATDIFEEMVRQLEERQNG